MEKSTRNNRKITRQWSKSEIKTVIGEFEARSELWDRSHHNYPNRFIFPMFLSFLETALYIFFIQFRKIQTSKAKFAGRNRCYFGCICSRRSSKVSLIAHPIQSRIKQRKTTKKWRQCRRDIPIKMGIHGIAAVLESEHDFWKDFFKFGTALSIDHLKNINLYTYIIICYQDTALID